jgi:hypothetical protein
MKIKLALLFISLIAFSNTSANLFEDLKPLGLNIDSMPNPSIESLVLVKMDSLNKRNAYNFEQYGCFPKIYNRGLFRDMPGIRYYHIAGCTYVTDVGERRFDYALLNENNHALYYPNGDLKSFNAVCGSSIKNNFKPSFITKLLFLYVITSDVRWPHLILGFYNDICNLYDLSQKDSHAYFWFLHVKQIKELYPSLGIPISVEKNIEHYKIEFNCFDGNRAIDHWVFNVYPDSISLVSKVTLKSNIDLTPR